MKLFLKNIAEFLFAKEHLARAFWSIVVALLAFVLGIWYNSRKEPSKVFVTNTPNMQDTLVLRIEGQSVDAHEALAKRIEQLAREVRSLRSFYSSTQGRIQSSDGIKPLEVGSPSSSQKEEPARLMKVPLAFDPVLAPIKVPRYRLPANVKGYSPGQLSTLGKFSLPKVEYSKNEEIRFTFEISDPSLIGKITPLIVDVLRKNSEHSYTLFYNQQYVIQRGQNLVSLVADFGSGQFILQAGFYFIEELNEEFPTFYRTQIEISVK